MRVAVEGCSHGCLDQIYASVRAIDERDGKRTDVVILCGDVQTLRNQADLHCLAVPDKYKQMGDFHRYYADAPMGEVQQGESSAAGAEASSTKRIAPYLTIMIGGNHEASNYLWELYYGGWVAPNIYYLGAAGCVEVGGLVIAGISGIYKSHDFTLGHHERMPYSPSAVRSIYHTRCFDTFRLHMLARQRRHQHRLGKDVPENPALVLSHDWPNTIEQHGNTQWLIQKKPFFREEVQSRSLGSPPLFDLLCDLKPAYWFSAHLHVKFAAVVRHQQSGANDKQASETAVQMSDTASALQADANAEEMVISLDDAEDVMQASTAAENPDEIAINDDDSEDANDPGVAAAPTSALKEGHETRFLSLSKCLEGQDFLQILDVPVSGAPEEKRTTKVSLFGEEAALPAPTQPTFRYHAPWLAVLRATASFLSLDKQQTPLPPLDDEALQKTIGSEREWIDAKLATHESKAVGGAHDFYGDDDEHPLAIRRVQRFVKTAPASNTPQGAAFGPPPWYTNPQTVALCDFIGIKNRINAPPEGLPAFPAHLPPKPTGNGTAQLPQGNIGGISEEEEIRRIEAAAQAAMKRKEAAAKTPESNAAPFVTLDDNEEDEQAARWKEGTG